VTSGASSAQGSAANEISVRKNLARDDVAAAERASERLAAVAAGSDSPALAAESALAGGRVAMAGSEAPRAAALLEEARLLLSIEERPLLCGAIRYESAVALRALGDMAAATHEARAALSVFERLGSTAQVDQTAALLRSLGASGRLRKAANDHLIGLTGRESQVVDLVRSGLTNAEIGRHLFISAKTAEHHVGRILTKLGVRSRAEAAALAVDASFQT
jgi:DNA-binding CsgD family transcriptional regulator